MVERLISDERPLVLASASPRRVELLRRAGLPVRVRPAAIDERRLPDETWPAAALRLAEEKARAVWQAGEWALGADTVVLLGEQGLNKPQDRADGLRMLRVLAGQEHAVVTGLAVVGPGGELAVQQAVTTRVRFRDLDEGELQAYLDSGEPFGKAGAYAIQGIGAALVRELHGSYTNVVGLPLAEVLEGLQAAGALAGPTLAGGEPALEEGGGRAGRRPGEAR